METTFQNVAKRVAIVTNSDVCDVVRGTSAQWDSSRNQYRTADEAGKRYVAADSQPMLEKHLGLVRIPNVISNTNAMGEAYRELKIGWRNGDSWDTL